MNDVFYSKCPSDLYERAAYYRTQGDGITDGSIQIAHSDDFIARYRAAQQCYGAATRLELVAAQLEQMLKRT